MTCAPVRCKCLPCVPARRKVWSRGDGLADNGINSIALSFAPSLLHGRLQMSGRAQGFHFAPNKPITSTLTALGFTYHAGQWPAAELAEHGANGKFSNAEDYVRFSRGVQAGAPLQEIVYNGGWLGGFSMGSVELQRFPFAVATKLGMLLHLDS